MSTMIERVARAIASKHDLDLPPDAMTYNMDNVLVPYWTLYVGDARAAIEAMREPNSAMIAAVDRAENERGYCSGAFEFMAAEDSWPVMIDAALNEEG